MKKGISLKVLAIVTVLMIVVSGVAPGIAVSNQSNDASNQLYEINECESFPTLGDGDINEVANKSIPEGTENPVNGPIHLLGQAIGLEGVALNSNESYELINEYRAQVLDTDTSSSHTIHALDVNVTFGKLTVRSEGVNGRLLDSSVRVYKQSTGDSIASGDTGSDGVISFYLAPGTYKAYISESNLIWRTDLVVTAGTETSTTAVFGRLNVHSEGVNGRLLDSSIRVYKQSTGDSVASGDTGSDGVISFYLAPGTYKARICEYGCIWNGDLVITAGNETTTTAVFGRLNVHSEGVNGRLLDSSVRVYKQSTGDSVASGDTGSDGVISFYLAPGAYKARICEYGCIWNGDLVITAGNETSTTAVFGGLNVHSRDFDGNPLDSTVRVYKQSTGDSVASGDTGSDGVSSFYLAPGTYKVKVRKSTDVWYYDIIVIAGKATNVGDYINHNPVINSITANPRRINPSGSTTIAVFASDVDGDILSYSYSTSIGTVIGSGSTALYTAPTTSDTYRIDVAISDGNGGTAQGCIFVSDRYGNLVVNSRGVNGAPLDSSVRAYKQSTGDSVASGNTGGDGTIAFSLLEDVYKIRVSESNEIWMTNVFLSAAGNVTNVSFGKLTVRSEGVNGRLLDSSIRVYKQSTGDSVASGDTGSDGVISFYLAPGTYKARICEYGCIWNGDLVITAGNETSTTAVFGRLNVHSEGVNGRLLDSSVRVYKQSTGDSVASGDTGSDGVISFYLAPGAYKARICEYGCIWNGDLVITAGNETSTTAVFGGLNVHSRDFDGNPLDSTVRVYKQSTGDSVASGDTGSDGVSSFYLAPGTYKVKVRKSTDVWYYDIIVIAGKATNVGDYINHNPVINSITANPRRINPSGSTTIAVFASDVDGDILSYSYSTSIGTVIGSGSTALYTAPTTSDTYRIDVAISDGNGGTAQGCIFVSDRYGNLVVNSRGVNGAPLDSSVRAYKQSTGDSVASGNTGGDGTIAFSLLEDVYKIRVSESNEIWMTNVFLSAAGNVTNVSFGKLTVRSEGVNGRLLDSSIRVYKQSTGDSVASGDTGSDGVISFYLAPGTYKARICEYGCIWNGDLVITAGNETSTTAVFGRLNVHSEGVNGRLLDSSVRVYKQSTGDSVASGDTGSDGVISFYLAPGAYKARICEYGCIWNGDLVITAGNETSTTAVFGGLNVHSRDFDGNPLDSTVRVYKQSTGDSVASGDTGSDGVSSFYLAPGTYKVKVRKSTDVWYYDIIVIAGKATNVGDYINHNPVINSITANPRRINPSGSTTIAVFASDVDSDTLSYSYSASVGIVVGSGSTASYTAPNTMDTYRIDVVVSDGNGGTAQGSIFVSDRYGNLVVNSRGVGGEPLDSYVYVYKQSTGASVDSERTGSDGTITFSLLEDIYKIKVRESSDIWVENILVLYGTTGIIIGDDINNSAPVINSYSPAQSSLSINEGESITFTANASDPDGTIPQYRWYLDDVFQSPLQAWTFYTSYTDSGNRSVTLEVTDGQYTVNQKWNVIVNNVNQNPIITNFYAANTTLSPLNSTDILVTAVDFDGDDLNYSWSSTGGKFSTTSANNATWIAPEMSGLYNITVIVSDGNGGNATESVIIAVGEVVKTEEFVVINGAKEYTIRLYFAEENGDILDLFRRPDPTRHDFPGIRVPLRPSNKWVIEKITVYNGEEEVRDEAELKQVLKALSGWVLAKYTTEHPINGKTSSFEILNHFSKTDDAPQGNLMDIIQTKDEALGLERWVTCPQSIIDFGAWEDAVATSVEQSFRAGGCPPGFEESEGTKLAGYVDEILEGIELNETDGVLVKGAIGTFVKALLLRSEGVKSLSFLDEYAATNSIELEEDFRDGVKEVITTYGTDNYEDIIKQAIQDGVQAAIADATAKTVDEIINRAVPKITSILRDKLSAQAATAFSSIVSGIGWGYLVADLTMDPCENFRILTSHSASMHVAQDYGKIEEVLMHDLASNREIDLTKAYSFITLRKMELSAIGQSYEALSRMGEISLLNSFLDLVGTSLGYTASKGDILNKADVYLYPAKNTEKLTEFLVNKALGEQDYSVEGGFISARMFRNEAKSFPITITPPINVEELEMYSLQWENAPKIKIKSHHSTGEQTRVDLNVFVPKDADIGIYRGLGVIKAEEKDFEVFFVITVLTDNILRVEILAPKDREELNINNIEIKAEVCTKKGSEIEPVTDAEVKALLTSVLAASKELEMKHRENGLYTVTTTLKGRCPYTLTVTAEKVCDTFFGFPTHCYEPGSDIVEFSVLIPE